MKSTSHEKWMRVALWQTPGVGISRYTQLLDAFGDAQSVFSASSADISQLVPEKVSQAIDSTKASFDKEKIQQILEQLGISVLVKTIDAGYPQILESVTQAPPVLYVKGDLLPQDNKAIAVVGTRKPTHYGLDVTNMLVEELCAQDFTIVSGLAFGIDATAHEKALESGGRTIAVLAHGLDRVYPTGNAGLALEIEKHGALISAFAPYEPPNRGNFVARDEWIAQISLGVLVTEGGQGSGSLITAQGAKKMGKPVFAVPGPITSVMNHAPTSLLKKGALPVSSAKDIIDSLGFISKEQKNSSTTPKASLQNPLQEKIYDTLAQEPLLTDELSRLLSIPVAKLAAELTLMEFAGSVVQTGESWQRA